MAYIDEVEEREGGVHKVYYSVLVKAVDNLDQVIILELSTEHHIELQKQPLIICCVVF